MTGQNKGSDIDLDALKAQAKKAMEQDASQKLALAKDVFATFNTVPGKKVLEYFKKYTINSRAPVFDPTKPFNEAAAMASYRSGQNAIWHEIELLIELGAKGK